MRKLLIFFLGLILFGCKSESKKEGIDEAVSPPSETTAPEKNTSSPVHDSGVAPEVAESIERGAGIYNDFCATCHLASGNGIENAFPPLNNSDWLKEKRKESIAAVKNGLKGAIKVNGVEYNSVMADLGLTDQEVADVMNYIFTAWDNSIGPPVTEEEVSELE